MKKTDARIINSKKYLKEALLSLLYEMRISEIKVVSLCQRAEINRATFYSHYNNVYELFNETINEFMNDICKFVSKLNENISKEESYGQLIYIKKKANPSDPDSYTTTAT